MDYRIFCLIEDVSRDLKKQVTVEKMAQNCELSREYFIKLFKQEVGNTPIQYIKTLRLERAKELLETTRKRVKEIMSEVGINDQTHFVRDFKEKYNLTPNEYRKNYWDKIQAQKIQTDKTFISR